MIVVCCAKAIYAGHSAYTFRGGLGSFRAEKSRMVGIFLDAHFQVDGEQALHRCHTEHSRSPTSF